LNSQDSDSDLYDVVNLYRHADSRPTATGLLDVLRQKCPLSRVFTGQLDGVGSQEQLKHKPFVDTPMYAI
jgi:hypothetical protein